VTVAGGKVFAAAVDAHTVYAFSAADGEPAWNYTAGGRIDSPPTIHRGLAIFGSADGSVCCLRASDGALAWRFVAALDGQHVIVCNQLESPWPVSGSVLVHEGQCWFVAGRSSYLDGGMHLFALDPATGRVARQETIFNADKKTGKMTPTPDSHNMPGVLADILATDGANVFLRQMNVTSAGARAGRHLFSTAGYLDSSWFNRTFWKVGGVQTTGIMVTADDVAYGVEVYSGKGRDTVFKPGAQGYRLACYSLTQSASAVDNRPKRRGKTKTGRKVLWQQQVPIRITAMVRTAEKLFVAGSPDVVDPDDPHAAWEGRAGGVLAALDAATGERLSEVKLSAPPTWDGMAAVDGRLFVALTSGELVCLGERE
jgi:outer membrane protein assembly factor BamB